MNETRTEPTLYAVPGGERPREAPEPQTGLPSAHAADAAAERVADQDQWPAPRGSRRRRRMRWIVALLALCAAVALWSMLWQPQTVSQLPSAAPKPPPAAPPQSTAPRYPIEAAAAALPPLDASDAAMLAALQALWGGGVTALVEPRDLVRNFVATVDNLPRRTLPVQKLPVKPAAGSFVTASTGNALVIGPSNAPRYAGYAKLLGAVDAQALVALYVRHYPLFQQAYRELGYPGGHFNDRLVEAIDMMLATPEPPATLAVVQPKIFYEFADRDLEQLPAGQKLMLRIGSDNAALARKRMREIRSLVTAQAPEAAPGAGLRDRPG